MAVDTATLEAAQAEIPEVTADPITDFDSFLEQSRKAALAEGGQSDQDAGAVQKAKAKAPSTDAQTPPEEQDGVETSEEEDADLDRPTTRREAFRLAEERQKALQESEAERKALLDQMESRKVADAALNKEVEQALGSDADYAALTRRARAGDRQAGAMLDQIDANRGFFGKLVQKAQRDVQAFFTSKLVEETEAIGLDKKTVWEGTPAQIVQAAYAAGKKAAEAELRPQIDGALARSKGDVAARAGKRGAPLSGGKPASLDAFDSLFGEDGLPTKEAILKAKRGELVL